MSRAVQATVHGKTSLSTLRAARVQAATAAYRANAIEAQKKQELKNYPFFEVPLTARLVPKIESERQPQRPLP